MQVCGWPPRLPSTSQNGSDGSVHEPSEQEAGLCAVHPATTTTIVPRSQRDMSILQCLITMEELVDRKLAWLREKRHVVAKSTKPATFFGTATICGGLERLRAVRVNADHHRIRHLLARLTHDGGASGTGAGDAGLHRGDAGLERILGLLG